MNWPWPAAAPGAAAAEAAGAREALVLARVDAEAQRTLRQAQVSREQWLRLADVARRMDDNAGLLEKAWRLGEGQFTELQNARRQAGGDAGAAGRRRGAMKSGGLLRCA